MSPSEVDPDERKPLSNKERQRKARQRKKKYYEELEDKVKFLENKIKNLVNQVEQYRSKIFMYENNDMCQKSWDNTDDATTCRREEFSLIDEVINYVNKLPDTITIQDQEEFVDNYGPFGKKKIKVLDDSFDWIIKNLIHDQHRLWFAVVDRIDFELSWDLFKKYQKMKKYEVRSNIHTPHGYFHSNKWAVQYLNTSE